MLDQTDKATSPPRRQHSEPEKPTAVNWVVGGFVAFIVLMAASGAWEGYRLGKEYKTASPERKQEISGQIAGKPTAQESSSVQPGSKN